MTKSEQRAECLARRNGLSSSEIKSNSQIIVDKLTSLPFFIAAQTIFCYYACSSEVQTTQIIDIALKNGKCLLLPVTHNRIMYAEQYSYNDQLICGDYGIMQPKFDKNNVINQNIDICITPLAAFDSNLSRIGYGGGYYDKFFSSHSTFKIGIAHSCQQVERVVAQPHDIRLDLIITEKGEFYGR